MWANLNLRDLTMVPLVGSQAWAQSGGESGKLDQVLHFVDGSDRGLKSSHVGACLEIDICLFGSHNPYQVLHGTDLLLGGWIFISQQAGSHEHAGVLLLGLVLFRE